MEDDEGCQSLAVKTGVSGLHTSHAWRLPAVINVCLWVYALPLLLAVNVETLSDPSKLIPQMHAFVYLAAVSPSRGEQ